MVYLICNIQDNMVEVVVKIKTIFRKHTLVEDQERRTVKYRPCGRYNQPNINVETRKKVTPMKVRRIRKEGTELGTPLDSSTWIPEGEGFGYPPKRFNNPNYPHTSEEEEQKEDHPCKENDGNATPDDYDSTNRSMLREEAPIHNKIKF